MFPCRLSSGRIHVEKHARRRIELGHKALGQRASVGIHCWRRHCIRSIRSFNDLKGNSKMENPTQHFGVQFDSILHSHSSNNKSLQV